MERIGTRSVALCVIRGFLGFFSTSTLNLTLLVFAKRFICYSLGVFCYKLNVIHSC